MIPSEILRQVRRIEIFTNRIVNETMSGRYSSAFKGQGIEFEEVREYQPGDDVRSIDWNVTARTGRPQVKRYTEERELSVLFIVDVSRSMAFGSVGALKSRIAAELCSVLAFSAIKNQDKVGLLLCSDRIESFVPPKSGTKHVLRAIREVLSYKPQGQKTRIKAALDYLQHVLHRKSVIFLISDFFDEDLRLPLSIANRRHDVIAVHLEDPRELHLPQMGFVRVRDSETGSFQVWDASDKRFQSAYLAAAQRRNDELRRMLGSAGVDMIRVRTDRSYVDPLVQFFRMRHRR